MICIPSKAVESWVAAALPADANCKIEGDIECDPNLPACLKSLRANLKIPRKRVPQYRKHASRITAEWSRICERCSQAKRFRDDVLSAMDCLDLGTQDL